jgi:acyl-CoA thioesterase I
MYVLKPSVLKSLGAAFVKSGRCDNAAMSICRRTALRAALAGLVPAAVLSVSGCARKKPAARAVPAGSVVLAVGDSLTHGTGAAASESYPQRLAALTGWQVINAGVPGDTSTQAWERLPALLAQHAPKLVLCGIGGNDFLRGQSADALRSNLEAMAHAVLATGAQWLLIAVPRPSAAAAAMGMLSDHPLYGELAEKHGWVLQRQGWAEVLSDDALRADRIHANASGYARFATSLAATARAAGLLT